VYRVVQFYRALTAQVRPDELEALAPLLGPQGMVLFRRLSRNDQRHSLNVYTLLHSQGYRDPALLTAALLHDVGKTTGKLSLFHRVAAVLLSVFSPRMLQRLEASDLSGLLRPFRVSWQHAELGARLLSEAGFAATTVELVRHHHEDPGADEVEDPLAEWVAALRRADGVN